MLMRLVRTYAAPYRNLLIWVIVFQFGQVSATLMLPTLNANIIDKGALTGDTAYIERMGAILLGITILQVCLAVAAMYFSAKFAMSFGRDVRKGLFHQVTQLSAREVGRFGSPSLITRVTNDVQQVQMLVLMTCTMAIAAPITLVVGTFLAIREDGPLSLILIVAVPALLGAMTFISRRMHPLFFQMQERLDRVNQVLREQITGIRVVRAFVREPDERKRFEESNTELTRTSLFAGRYMALSFPFVFAAVNISSVAAVWFGANRIAAGEMQVGSLVAFLTYLIQILMAVMMATWIVMMYPRAAVCAGRIQDVLHTDSTVVPPTNGVKDLPGPMSLELHHASFAFPGAEKPVLNDISVRVDAGETLAIIGSTGSGKTALLNLVARLFDVTEGKVTIAGADIRDIDSDYLHTLIGFVPQKPFLFSGTVASNLRFGNPQADETDIWAALDVAQASDFVQAMPDGIRSPIAQGGTNVSGGQRQRLAIARAVAHRPSIYLFDDSFSALDLKTDARLRSALRPVTREAVTVVVAQRVSTITQADRILVLEEGCCVGLGTHAELLATCPTYQEIVESQRYNEDAA
ncbi:MAG: ABC transporter ATP-binding protein [Acidimicrobiia bacterium]